MTVPLPALVAPYEVHQFVAELDQAVDRGGLVLLLNSISDIDAPTFVAADVERRLLAVMRLAAQATYWSGEHVVKIVNLGDRWDPADPVSGYLRAAAVAKHVDSLARSGYASLGRIESWAGDGPPNTAAYRESIELIQGAMRMMNAFDHSISDRLAKMDLWFEHTTTPFRPEAEGLLELPDRFLTAGHLINFEPPAFDWSDERSTILSRCMSPFSVGLSPADFSLHVLRELPAVPRHLLVKAPAGVGSAAGLHQCFEVATEMHELKLSVLIQVDASASADDVAASVVAARGQGAATTGLELLLADSSHFDEIVDIASNALVLLYPNT